MNPYMVFIFTLLATVFLLDMLSDSLNLSYLSKPLPSEFKEIYNPQKYDHYLQYQTSHTRLELVRRTVFFIATITFILLGGFNSTDLFARSFNFSSIGTGLIFVGTLSLLRFLLQLPFSIYETFVLEERFGFNKTTLRTFILDILKGAILGSILGGFIFAGMIYFFETTGSMAWLYSWTAITLFQLILAFVAPVWIMPLFNKFSPLPEGPLKEAIQNYAKTRNFQLQGIFTMDSSKRSTKSNAFFTGFGRFRRLVLFDTLIEKHSIDELVAILAHEIGHFEKKHILKSLLLSILTSGFVFYTFGLFMNNPDLFSVFQMDHTSVYASIIFIGFLYSPILRVLSIFTQKLSRKFEFEADAFARETYGRPELLISALKKLSVDNLSHLTPHPLKIILDYSHPPILKRIAALRQEEYST